MIIIRLTDGLGNQMFQYAAARRISILRNTELKLHFNYPDVKGRQFGLGPFNIRAQVAQTEEVENLIGAHHGRFRRKLKNWIGRPTTIAESKSLDFDDRLLKAPDNVYITGYWQSPRYFQGIEETLAKEFSLTSGLSSPALAVADRMERTTSVSLHVRRGDYVSDPGCRRLFLPCGAEYYRRAVEHFKSSISSLHLFVFSDDLEWARQNLKYGIPTEFVAFDSPTKDQEELTLMGRCKHQIIANSTFSWWGAWLNPSATKQVIAPKEWFAPTSTKFENIIPKHWLRL